MRLYTAILAVQFTLMKKNFANGYMSKRQLYY